MCVFIYRCVYIYVCEYIYIYIYSVIRFFFISEIDGGFNTFLLFVMNLTVGYVKS